MAPIAHQPGLQGVTKAVRLPSWSGRWFWGARPAAPAVPPARDLDFFIYFDWRT
jgi:hypothetical protein